MDYSKLINIKSQDRLNDIRETVFKVINEVNQSGGTYDGLCKYVANNIRYELNNKNIRSYLIDLNQFDLDHVFLVAEYNNSNIIRVLIDPTISQFNIGEKAFAKNKEILTNLLNDGYSIIDDEMFNNYIHLLTNEKRNFTLDNDLISLSEYNGKIKN